MNWNMEVLDTRTNIVQTDKVIIRCKTEKAFINKVSTVTNFKLLLRLLVGGMNSLSAPGLGKTMEE